MENFVMTSHQLVEVECTILHETPAALLVSQDDREVWTLAIRKKSSRYRLETVAVGYVGTRIALLAHSRH
jgi:hypothetical protein